MEETSLRTNLAPESLTRSFSVEVPATRELRAFLHSLLFPLCSFLCFSEECGGAGWSHGGERVAPGLASECVAGHCCNWIVRERILTA